MPTPIEILLDPVSLIIIAMYIGVMVWEALFPARELPKVRYWKLKGLTTFFIFFYLSSYLPLFTDPYLENYRLFNLNGLGTAGGAMIGILLYELSLYVWHRAMRDTKSNKEFYSLLHIQFTGFETGLHEVFDGTDGVINAHRKELEEVPQNPEATIQWIKHKVYDNIGICWCQLDVKLHLEHQFFELKNLRMTSVWLDTQNGWKTIHSHYSMPYAIQKSGEAFPLKELEARNLELEQLVEEKTASLKKEKEKTESLLHNILPIEVAKELMKTGKIKPRRFDEVTILISDFKEFTNIVASIPTQKLIYELNEIFSQFDDIMESEKIEKIQTVGDAYLAAAGLPKEMPDHAIRCVKAAKKMIDYLNKRNETSAIKWKIRIGIHSGPISAGMVGKKKFAYDIFGDTLNTASRMETAGEEGRINVSAYTYDLIKDKYPCEYRGKISAKGKGDLDMYFVS